MTDAITITREHLVTLATEHWRLHQALEAAGAGPVASRALRKLGELLKALRVEARSLDGTYYDAGLSARVVDRIESAQLGPGIEVIVETISPLVLYEGNVLQVAEVVIAAGATK